jgi:glycosyltransferase involved in cell wall biosynthesis
MSAVSMSVSVVATVYNERASIDRLLDSLMAQSRQPDELVICDGGSKDGTVEHINRRLAAWQDGPRYKILVEAGANISRGRNLAIGAAEGPIIAVTDAGVRLDPRWLAELVQPWAQDEVSPRAVGGFFLPDVQGIFQTAMAATVLPLEVDIDPARFLPSSRSVAFLKESWRRAGKYPEWLDYSEDLVFDLRVNGLGSGTSQFVWRPGARVYFQPRTTLRAFWRQYYLYARGDGKADLWRKRHAVRYLVYLVLLPALIGHGVWGRFWRSLGWLGLAVGVVAYCMRPWQRVFILGKTLSKIELLQALAWVPVIRAVGDLAKLAGYPVGLWWRRQNRRRSEIHWHKETAPVDDPDN